MKDDLLKLTPMTEYEAPELPTLKEVEPDVLVKVPKRWQSKAVMATAVGLFGATVLTGCNIHQGVHHGGEGGAPIYVANPTENEVLGQIQNKSFLDNRNYCQIHHGGFSGAPLYVAYLSEQEALGIIRQELERVGIGFMSDTQGYAVEFVDPLGWEEDSNVIEVNLLSAVNNIAISIINPNDFLIPWMRFDMTGITDLINNEFVQNYPHLAIGLFCNPEIWHFRNIEDARAELRENITLQAQEFINHLRENGVLD